MGKPITFLLVDDDMDDTALFGEVLNEVNPSVTLYTAVNGLEALEKLEHINHLPDLVFLDLNMPRMGGKECLVHIKKDARLSQIPVIIYTTSSQSKDIEEAMMSGAVCFITKPSSMRELRSILSSVVESLPADLGNALRRLSNQSNTFIVC